MARILLIDDEANIRMMVSLLLETEGHKVTSAADGPEGLEKFEDGAGFHLTLLDQRMPGMEGLEVLKEIRSRKADAKVIMITAFGTIDLAVDAMKLGAKDFLRKPFTDEVLLGSINAVLEGRPLETSGQSNDTSEPVLGLSTVNGFHIHSQWGGHYYVNDQLESLFNATSPSQQTEPIKVVLPMKVLQQIQDYISRETIPFEARFWQALTEEALANYLWQNAAFPPDGRLVVDTLTSGLKNWIDAVLTAQDLSAKSDSQS